MLGKTKAKNSLEVFQQKTFLYTFSGIMGGGALLLCMLIYPYYFVGDVKKKLEEFSQLMVALEKALVLFLGKKFDRESNAALGLISFSSHQVSKDFLLKAAAFEVFAIAIQKGLTISSRDFKIESSIIPDLCLQAKTLREVIMPIFKKYGWSLRIFSRILSPYIFYFSL